MISVVVPIYKVELYLPRCIESIINQTYTDLEIILINDGSPDRCGEICDEYAEKDNRIRVIHKENGGLSDARNAGIAIAKGELITFVDSDDYIAPDMIEYLFAKMKQHDADITICAYQSVYNESTKFEYIATLDDNVIMSGVEAMDALFTMKSYAHVAAWGKLFKTELFTKTDISFPVGRINEDLFTTYQLFYHSTKVVNSSRKLYYYYHRSNSIMRQAFSLKNLDAVEAARQAIEFVSNNNLPLVDQVQYQYIVVSMGCINSIVYTTNWREWIGQLRNLRSDLFKIIPEALSNRYLGKGDRLSLLTLKLGCWLYIPSKKLSVKIRSAFKGMER